MWDEEGRQYLDFLAGAGTLNYGHNNSIFKHALLKYIKSNGITHGLDLHTKAKGEFLQAFNDHILKPRNMEYCDFYQWISWCQLGLTSGNRQLTS